MTTPSEPKPDRPARMVGLTLLLGSLTMFGPISIDLYLPSLPAIAADFGASAADAQRTLAAFLIGLAIGQLFYGPLSDRIGRRPPLLIGIAIYIAASFACAGAGSIEWLIGLRFLQALGACTGMVIARAVVMDMLPRHEAARMFSLLMLVLGLAPILAPIAGGRILLVAEWPVIFYMLMGFGALVGFAVLLWLPESRTQATVERARLESPLVAYGHALRQLPIIGYALAGGLGGACFFTFIAASPDLLIETYGVSPQGYGWIFGLLAVGFIAASQVNRHLLQRLTPHQLLLRGLLFGLAGALALLAVALGGHGSVWALVAPLFVVTSSLGFVMPNGVAGAMSIDLERSGTIAALVGSLQFVAGALGAATVGLLHDGSALPMAGVITVGMVLGLISLRGLVGPIRSLPATD